MNNYNNCKTCDKSIKIKSKKKHLNSFNHNYLSDSIRYIIQNPDSLQMEKILKNYVLDCDKKMNLIQLYANGFCTSLTLLLVLNLMYGGINLMIFI